MDGRIGAYAALAGGFILAGSSVVAGKVLSDLPVFFAAAGGAAIALLALVPLASREARPDRGALRRSLPLLAAQAFFGVALFRVLMLAALTRTSAAEAGIATSATSAITALLSVLFLKERIGWRAAAGVALTALGIAALESGGGPPGGLARTLDPRSIAGCLLALGAAASESVFNVLSKKLDASIGPRRASAIVMGMAFVLLALLSLASGERIEWGSIGLERGLAFAYQGLFSSALAYLLFFTGIARVPASTAGVFAGFIPLSSFALSILFLGERPGAAAFAGCALAISGILLCAEPEGDTFSAAITRHSPNK
ncbi:MAG: DMT family transporter [Spirochaetaceae bacterium]|nr:DMT family transporter [Spirochaetaceae bacterium]